MGLSRGQIVQKMSADAVEVKQSPIERAIAKFGAYFEERGLGASDIPAAIVVHELIGLVIAAGAWTVSLNFKFP